MHIFGANEGEVQGEGQINVGQGQAAAIEGHGSSVESGGISDATTAVVSDTEYRVMHGYNATSNLSIFNNFSVLIFCFSF